MAAQQRAVVVMDLDEPMTVNGFDYKKDLQDAIALEEKLQQQLATAEANIKTSTAELEECRKKVASLPDHIAAQRQELERIKSQLTEQVIIVRLRRQDLQKLLQRAFQRQEKQKSSSSEPSPKKAGEEAQSAVVPEAT